MTRRELAEEFHVSDDAIDRDLLILTRYAPLNITRGRNGGVEILNDYTGIIRPYLTNDELRLLQNYQQNASDKDKNILKKIIYKFSIPPTSNKSKRHFE